MVGVSSAHHLSGTPDHGRSFAWCNRPPEAVQALRGYIPQLRLAPIQEAGHSIHREQLDEYIQVVRTYLAQFS